MKHFFSIIFLILILTFQVFSQSGSLDENYNQKGFVTIDSDFPGNRTASFSAIQKDGKIICSGYKRIGMFNNNVTLTRLNPDGSIDTEFGENGIVEYDSGAEKEWIQAITTQADGKILLVIYAKLENHNSIVLRLNINGTLDNSFGKNGKATIDMGSDAQTINSIKVQNDGHIIIAGIIKLQGKKSFGIMKLLPNGVLDKKFAENGIFRYNYQSKENRYELFTIIGNSIFIVGLTDDDDFNRSDSEIIILKLNENGNFDNSFGDKGVVTYNIENVKEIVNCIQTIDDKWLFIGGSFGNKNFVMVINAKKGSLNTKFGTEGISILDFDYEMRDMAILSNKDILLAGYAGQVPNENICSVKLTSKGMVNNNYGQNGIAIINLEEPARCFNVHIIDSESMFLTGIRGNFPKILIAKIKL